MPTKVLAPMVGKILEVKVKPGDRVQQGQQLMVMASMKLENGIFAPADGTVKEVLVSPEDRIQEEDLLAIIQ